MHNININKLTNNIKEKKSSITLLFDRRGYTVNL